MKFDEVLTSIGEFGPYQKRLYVAICLPMAFHAIQTMSTIFTMAIPDHRCAIPRLENDTYAVQNAYHEDLIALYIPLTSDGYSPCDIYDVEPFENTQSHPGDNSSLPLTIPCHRWVYDQAVYHDTVISEADLVCSKSIFRAHATTAYFVGALVGLAIIGATADRYGRKKTSYILLLCMLTSSLLLLWLPDIKAFIAIRILNGISFGSLFTLTYVYVMEFIGPSRRGTWGLCANNFWAMGVLIQAGIAYGIRSWRYLQLAFSLPILVCIAYWWLLPESPRWLLVKGHSRRGHEILKVIARGNGVDVDAGDTTTDVENENQESGSNTILLLFKHRSLAIRSLILFWNWFVVAMLFFGVGLNVSNLSGNLYLNFAISGLVEIVGYTLCIPLVNVMGRKRSQVIMLGVGGICLLLTIVPEVYGNESTRWVTTALSMLGKLVSSAAYSTMYIYSVELFPTIIRGSVMAGSSILETVVFIVAPYVVEMATILDGQLATVAPMLVFGAVSLSASLLALVLPETAGTNLPDNIQDMMQGKRKRQLVQTRSSSSSDETVGSAA